MRIGNYVQRDDLASREPRFEQVLELGSKVTTTGPVKVICDYNDIKPIPLTEQWLIDFRFKKDNNGYYWIEFKEDCTLRVCDGSVEIWPADGCTYGHCVELFCPQVHYLQNLYFSLTGEELTIKTTSEV